MEKSQSDLASQILAALQPGGGAPETKHPGLPPDRAQYAAGQEQQFQAAQERFSKAYDDYVAGLLGKPSSTLTADERKLLMQLSLQALDIKF